MHHRDDDRREARWIREIVAGCTGAVTVLPVVLTLGLITFSPLGAAAPPVALLAAFVTAGIGGLVHAVLSRTSLPVAGPSSPTALTLAALAAQLVLDPNLAPSGAVAVQGIVALCSLALLLSGALQIGFAWPGLARLARVVPQPVLAGFMNSTAVLIVLAQVPLLLNLPLGVKPHLGALGTSNAASLVLGMGTAAFIWRLARRWPRLPAALLGLVAGTAVHLLWSSLVGGLTSGASIGALPSAWPWVTGPAAAAGACRSEAGAGARRAGGIDRAGPGGARRHGVVAERAGGRPAAQHPARSPA
jgi:sulfate permease, SulP family